MAYSKIEERLLLFTDHPLKAFLISIVFTGILQSSSAFMVIVIGFVSAGVLSFKRTIPMILEQMSDLPLQLNLLLSKWMF